MKTKKYAHDWERIDQEGYSPRELAMEILEDEELESLEEIVIGQYTPGYDMGIDSLLEALVENKDKLQGIKSFFFGDMDSMECEVSWIEQGDYQEFFQAFPNVEKLTIKGSNQLKLGHIKSKKLKKLEIITGGLPASVIEDITYSELENLESLIIYLGVEDYGFDGGIGDIKNLIEKSNFPNLKELGLVNSEIQDEIVDLVLKSQLLKELEILRLSYGSLTDRGGQLLLDNIDKLSHLKELDLEYNYLSDVLGDKLDRIGIKVNTKDRNEIDVDEYNGETYYYMYPMLTE